MAKLFLLLNNAMLNNHGHLNIDNSLLLEKIMRVSADTTFTNERPKENRTYTWEYARKHPDCSTANPHKWPEFEPVMKVLDTFIDRKQISISWFNVVKPKGYVSQHDHTGGASDSVFVYYVSCHKDHPPLKFLYENNYIEKASLSGDWIWFPNTLAHSVDINNAVDDRICIAININKTN